MMSEAKWFVVRKPSTGEIIAISANQIVPPEIPPEVQECYTIFTRPSFPPGGLKGGLDTRLVVALHVPRYKPTPRFLCKYCK